jgi:hypothetical protein
VLGQEGTGVGDAVLLDLHAAHQAVQDLWLGAGLLGQWHSS